MRLKIKPMIISTQLSVKAISSVNATPKSMNIFQSLFFMPLKSPMAPRNGAITATARLAMETTYP